MKKSFRKIRRFQLNTAKAHAAAIPNRSLAFR